MTIQRTLRIDDEMVERGRNTIWMKALNVGPTMVRQALEAALSPYLERRVKERRAQGCAPTWLQNPDLGVR